MRPPRRQTEAVALRYRVGEDPAPKVAAKGRGMLAERIIDIARRHNIPIRQDTNLVRILGMLNLEQEIPAEVYRAVAEILAFVYRLSNRLPPGLPGQTPAKPG